MKKIAPAMITVSMLLALAACGTDTPQLSSSTSTVPSSSSQTSTSSAPANAELTIQESSVGFCSYSGIIDTKHSGYSGLGFVDTENQSGASIEWQVQVAMSNTYNVTVRYANGGTGIRSGMLVANGNSGASAYFELQTTSAWTDWAEETRLIALNAGTNRLQLIAQNAEGLANIDYIRLSGSGISAATCSVTASSVSSTASSSSSLSSIPSGPVTIRAPKLEGFGAGTTGGAGGKVVYASTGTQINEAMCGRTTKDEPLIIRVNGTIHHGNTTDVSGNCDATATEIQFKGVSNISIIGVGTSGVLDQIGIHLRDTNNIIIQNLTIKNVKKSGSPISNGGDAIGMESGVHNVWVDHNDIHASGGESDGYDSLVDMKATVTKVTISYNYFHDSGRGGLMGSSDSDDTNTDVTFHHNYYRNMDSRLPLLRHGLAHSYNNYFNGINKSGMNPRIGGRIKVERNYFENAVNPLGTFYTSDMGYWDVTDNFFASTVTWKTATDELPAGPNVQDTTTINIPYSVNMDPVQDVPAIVTANAGVGKM